LTCSACCLEWQQAEQVSPWSATFIINGLITPPYAQCRVMRSVGLAGLVGAGLAGEHCA
jgi:hypothetical protein